MSHAPMLYVGYTPTRIKEVAISANQLARPPDIHRFGPSLTLSDLQSIQVLSQLTTPQDAYSFCSVLLLDLEFATDSVQSALLRLLESTSPAHFILHAPDLTTVLPTLQSRCHITQIPTPTYASLVQDLSTRLTTAAAVHVSKLLVEGLSLEQVPDAEAMQFALKLLSSCTVRGASVAVIEQLIFQRWEAFTERDLTAFRYLLLRDKYLIALQASYANTEPHSALLLAILALLN